MRTIRNFTTTTNAVRCIYGGHTYCYFAHYKNSSPSSKHLLITVILIIIALVLKRKEIGSFREFNFKDVPHASFTDLYLTANVKAVTKSVQKYNSRYSNRTHAPAIAQKYIKSCKLQQQYYMLPSSSTAINASFTSAKFHHTVQTVSKGDLI